MLLQLVARLGVVLRVAQGHGHIQLVQGAAGFYAKRAGVELVQRKFAGALLDRSLNFWCAFKLGRTADPVEEDDQLAEADAQCLDNHAGQTLGR